MPLSVVHRWLGRSSKAAPSRYQVTCPCGGVASGTRQEKFQVVACPNCGRSLFVLPSSRLPPVASLEESQGRSGRRSASRARWWMPLTAAAITLIVVIAIFVVVLGRAIRERGAERVNADTINRQVLAGKKTLALGKFSIAAKELEAAQKLRERNPEALPPAERRQLNQLQRQAALLADLSTESVDEILRHAVELIELDEQEWQTQFERRHRGKAIVFDDEVRRDGGNYQMLGWRFFVRGKPARIDLSGVQLLKALPLDKPQRLIFGVRLAGVRLEPGGTWVVQFEPDSGVLLTDPGAAASCCPIPAEELGEILERQAAWTANLP